MAINRPNRKTIRMQNWDYGWAASYFITICTKNRTDYFGVIKNGQCELSPIGVIADIFWHEIKNHAKNIELGEFVVMPNHIHGILTLTRDNGNHASNTTQTPGLDPVKSIGQKRFQNQGKNTVSSIIGGYKSAVTKHARRLGFEFGWQPRFWDHVIRDENSHHRIAQYIINNPQKWEMDKFYG